MIMDAVADSGIQFLKTNDEGDCATHLGFIFDDENYQDALPKVRRWRFSANRQQQACVYKLGAYYE